MASCKNENQSAKKQISTDSISLTIPKFANKGYEFNNDGKFSISEAKGKLNENFSKRDKNKDSYITIDEMTKSNQ